MWFNPSEILVLKNPPSAIPAIPAIPDAGGAKSTSGIAGIATLKILKNTFFAANDPTPDLTPRYGWLVHFTDREPAYVTYSPMATHAEVLQGYPDAVAAEPADSAPTEPAAP